MKSDTLIVVAAVDDRFDHHLPLFRGGDVIRVDTSGGGHPSKAFIDTYRNNYYQSYLFLQDSLEPTVENVVEPFSERDMPVVAWGLFPLQWDSDGQRTWVQSQYPPGDPEWGIFGPIFYADHASMLALDNRGLFPKTPPDRHMAQGTERAWSYAFRNAGIPVDTLGYHNNDEMASGRYPVFRKTFAARP